MFIGERNTLKFSLGLHVKLVGFKYLIKVES